VLCQTIVPPTGLAPARAPVPVMFGDSENEARKAGWLPGSYAPRYLTGELAGDVGFDPLCLVQLARTGTAIDRSNKWGSVDRKARMVMCTPYEARRKVMWMREAEVKHARLAMVAAAGWPISELLDGPLSKLFGLPNQLASGGRAPSLFNGHLFEGPQGAFVLLVALAISYLEANTLDNVEGLTPTGYVPGDLGFDPLKLGEKRPDMHLAEIKHGRVAMLAVAGFSVQEAIWRTPVVEQTPQFFHPTLPF